MWFAWEKDKDVCEHVWLLVKKSFLSCHSMAYLQVFFKCVWVNMFGSMVALVWWVVSCLRRGCFCKCLPSLCSCSYIYISEIISYSHEKSHGLLPLSKCFLLKWVFHGSDSLTLIIYRPNMSEFLFMRCSFKQAMFWTGTIYHRMSFVFCYTHREK